MAGHSFYVFAISLDGYLPRAHGGDLGSPTAPAESPELELEIL